MLKDVIEVKPLKAFKLKLRFEDGVTSVVDLEEIIEFTGVFRSLKDRQNFIQVYVDPDLGTICWPSGADIDPDVLYSLATDQPIPDLSVSTTESVGG